MACAAAVASCDIFERDGVLAHVRQRTDQLRERLARDVRPLPHVGDIRQWGLMVGIELVRDRQTREPYAASERIGMRGIRHARQQGIILRPLGNVVVLMPPLSITAAEIETLCTVVRDAIRRATEDTVS